MVVAISLKNQAVAGHPEVNGVATEGLFGAEFEPSVLEKQAQGLFKC